VSWLGRRPYHSVSVIHLMASGADYAHPNNQLYGNKRVLKLHGSRMLLKRSVNVTLDPALLSRGETISVDVPTGYSRSSRALDHEKSTACFFVQKSAATKILNTPLTQAA
jgi:hypothetical protein